MNERRQNKTRPPAILRRAGLLLAVLLPLAGCAPSEPASTAPSPPPATAAIRPSPSPSSSPSPTPSPSPSPSPTPALSPSISPAAEPYALLFVTGCLAPGDRGDQVLMMQKMLAILGFSVPETGVYCLRTRNAVRAFQRFAGLKADGILSQPTCQTLNIWCCATGGRPVDRERLALEGFVVCIDPGHQARLNSGQEPVSPGSSKTKSKVSGGTRGIVTRLYEYELNLEVGLRLRDLLETMGAEVIMTRETHDVNISNVERAGIANEAQADLFFRIHANGSDDRSRAGMFMLVPAVRGYVTEELAERSALAAQFILEAAVAATGAKNLGFSTRSDLSGFNWSRVPVCLIEMGHMTNAEEDRLLASAEYQDLLACGIAQGIAAYLLAEGG